MMLRSFTGSRTAESLCASRHLLPCTTVTCDIVGTVCDYCETSSLASTRCATTRPACCVAETGNLQLKLKLRHAANCRTLANYGRPLLRREKLYYFIAVFLHFFLERLSHGSLNQHSGNLSTVPGYRLKSLFALERHSQCAA